MPLLGSRLNSARFASILADLQTQFPAPGLLTAEVTAFNASQSKIAHAIADHEGTDVVAEVVTNALVAIPQVTLVTAGTDVSGPGTGTVS